MLITLLKKWNFILIFGVFLSSTSLHSKESLDKVINSLPQEAKVWVQAARFYLSWSEWKLYERMDPHELEQFKNTFYFSKKPRLILTPNAFQTQFERRLGQIQSYDWPLEMSLRKKQKKKQKRVQKSNLQLTDDKNIIFDERAKYYLQSTYEPKVHHLDCKSDLTLFQFPRQKGQLEYLIFVKYQGKYQVWRPHLGLEALGLSTNSRISSATDRPFDLDSAKELPHKNQSTFNPFDSELLFSDIEREIKMKCHEKNSKHHIGRALHDYREQGFLSGQLEKNNFSEVMINAENILENQIIQLSEEASGSEIEIVKSTCPYISGSASRAYNWETHLYNSYISHNMTNTAVGVSVPVEDIKPRVMGKIETYTLSVCMQIVKDNQSHGPSKTTQFNMSSDTIVDNKFYILFDTKLRPNKYDLYIQIYDEGSQTGREFIKNITVPSLKKKKPNRKTQILTSSIEDVGNAKSTEMAKGVDGIAASKGVKSSERLHIPILTEGTEDSKGVEIAESTKGAGFEEAKGVKRAKDLKSAEEDNVVFSEDRGDDLKSSNRVQGHYNLSTSTVQSTNKKDKEDKQLQSQVSPLQIQKTELQSQENVLHSEKSRPHMHGQADRPHNQKSRSYNQKAMMAHQGSSRGETDKWSNSIQLVSIPEKFYISNESVTYTCDRDAPLDQFKIIFNGKHHITINNVTCPYGRVLIDFGDLLAPHQIEVLGLNTTDQVVARDVALFNTRLKNRDVIQVLSPQRDQFFQNSLPVEFILSYPDPDRIKKAELLWNTDVIWKSQNIDKLPLRVKKDIDLKYKGEVGVLTVLVTRYDNKLFEKTVVVNSAAFSEDVFIEDIELFASLKPKHKLFNTDGIEFLINEDGKRQSILNTSILAETPTNFGLIVDASSSMKSNMQMVFDASTQFFHWGLNGFNQQNRGFLIHFHEVVDNTVLATRSIEDLYRGLSKISNRGETKLYDAIAQGIYEAAQIFYPTILIVISDGEDTQMNRNGTYNTNQGSKIRYETLLQLVEQSHVRIYPISINFLQKDESALHIERLDEIAKVSGTQRYDLKSMNELSSIFRQIQEDLNNTWLITYKGESSSEEKERLRAVDIEYTLDGGSSYHRAKSRQRILR